MIEIGVDRRDMRLQQVMMALLSELYPQDNYTSLGAEQVKGYLIILVQSMIQVIPQVGTKNFSDLVPILYDIDANDLTEAFHNIKSCSFLHRNVNINDWNHRFDDPLDINQRLVGFFQSQEFQNTVVNRQRLSDQQIERVRQILSSLLANLCHIMLNKNLNENQRSYLYNRTMHSAYGFTKGWEWVYFNIGVSHDRKEPPSDELISHYLHHTPYDRSSYSFTEYLPYLSVILGLIFLSSVAFYGLYNNISLLPLIILISLTFGLVSFQFFRPKHKKSFLIRMEKFYYEDGNSSVFIQDLLRDGMGLKQGQNQVNYSEIETIGKLLSLIEVPDHTPNRNHNMKMRLQNDRNDLVDNNMFLDSVFIFLLRFLIDELMKIREGKYFGSHIRRAG